MMNSADGEIPVRCLLGGSIQLSGEDSEDEARHIGGSNAMTGARRPRA